MVPSWKLVQGVALFSPITIFNNNFQDGSSQVIDLLPPLMWVLKDGTLLVFEEAWERKDL